MIFVTLQNLKQIRTQCDEDCPEDCRNEKSWEYYNKDSDNEDKMWHKDGTMKIICVGKCMISLFFFVLYEI